MVCLIFYQQMLISKYWEQPLSTVAQNRGRRETHTHTQLVYNSLEFRHYYSNEGKTTYFDYLFCLFIIPLKWNDLRRCWERILFLFVSLAMQYLICTKGGKSIQCILENSLTYLCYCFLIHKPGSVYVTITICT
jgi:hypothetical protein